MQSFNKMLELRYYFVSYRHNRRLKIRHHYLNHWNKELSILKNPLNKINSNMVEKDEQFRLMGSTLNNFYTDFNTKQMNSTDISESKINYSRNLSKINELKTNAKTNKNRRYKILNQSYNKINLRLNTSLDVEKPHDTFYQRPKSDLAFTASRFPRFTNKMLNNMNKNSIFNRDDDRQNIVSNSMEHSERKEKLASLERTMKIYLESQAQQEDLIRKQNFAIHINRRHLNKEIILLSFEEMIKLFFSRALTARAWAAAVHIQRVFRGFKARKLFHFIQSKRGEAASKLQKAWKRFRLFSLIPKTLKYRKKMAIITIQKYLRGFKEFSIYNRIIQK